jgi:hypothetical protein
VGVGHSLKLLFILVSIQQSSRQFLFCKHHLQHKIIMTSLSSKSSTLQTTSAGAEEGAAAWRQRVSVVQRERQTPEALARVQRRSEARVSAKRNASKAKRLQTVQAYSKSAWAGSAVALRSATPAYQQQQQQEAGAALAPQQASPQQMSSFGASAALQSREEANARADVASKAMLTLQRAASAEEESDAEEAIENAREQLASAGFEFATRGAEGAAEAADFLGCSAYGGDNDNDNGAGGGGEGSGGVLAELQNDLKQEPADDADAARRFALYEQHAETTAAVRTALFNFWDGAKADVDEGAPKASIEASLKAVDGEEHLELHINPSFWFVYSMARKVASNEAALGRVLQEIRTKLELLANADDDCPMCLEPIGEGDGVALGCAHKLHAECWKHWSAHCATSHKTPFCPLCRSDEFLEEILV